MRVFSVVLVFAIGVITEKTATRTNGKYSEWNVRPEEGEDVVNDIENCLAPLVCLFVGLRSVTSCGWPSVCNF